MKNFKSYTPEKYMTSDFEQIEEGIIKPNLHMTPVIRIFLLPLWHLRWNRNVMVKKTRHPGI